MKNNHFRDLVTYERESGDVLERFNESLNMVRANQAIVSIKIYFSSYFIQIILQRHQLNFPIIRLGVVTLVLFP